MHNRAHDRSRWFHLRLACAAIGLSLTPAVGSSYAQDWPMPCIAEPQPADQTPGKQAWFEIGNVNGQLSIAEHTYALAVAQHHACQETCVDLYYQTLVSIWPLVRTQFGQPQETDERVWALYHSSLAMLISSSQEFSRLQLPHGLIVETETGRKMIPITFHRFLWQPQDFQRLSLVGNYQPREVKTIYRQAGMGVPLIAHRDRREGEWLFQRETIFPATALMRPRPVAGEQYTEFVLEVYDPRRISHIAMDEHTVCLHRDLSAPLEFRVDTAGDDYLTAFLQPGSTANDEGLFMIEPYQPGKIPIVFVHGLLSRPTTWVVMANELLASSELMDRYQLWAFEYPTGAPFVESAADLREQLHAVRCQLDPHRQDPALDQMVLVGHSMGGLISKLQISYSGHELWDSVASIPIDQVVMSSRSRTLLTRYFFFDPVPTISRVIYIGVPHRGSAWASRSVGRLGSGLVETPEDQQSRHQQLIDNNPGVFSREMEQRVPTSVDLMNPRSPLLQAIDQLPKSPRVRTHSIIGTGRWMVIGGPADGVVTVDSARQDGVETEQLARRTHTGLHRSDEVIEEVFCILRRHLETVDAHHVAPVGARVVRED